MINIKFVESPLNVGSTAVVVLDKAKSLSRQAAEVASSVGVKVEQVMDVHGYKAGFGESLVLPTTNKEIKNILVFGVGKLKDLSENEAYLAGIKLYQKLECMGAERASLHLSVEFASDELKRQAVFNLLLGCQVASYKFDKYKTQLGKDACKIYGADACKTAGQDSQGDCKDAKKKGCKELEVVFANHNQTNLKFEAYKDLASSMALAKDLVSEVPNVKNPIYMAAVCEDLKKYGVDVQVLDEKEMALLGMNALLGVAQGSVNPPRLVVMHWNGGAKGQQPVALVGKGVTFDSGGLSLKPCPGMETMKNDMAGSAVVIGAIRTLAMRKTKVNAIGVIGLVENMPDGAAQRPSDVVKSMSGQTIEILNTDAEGRLVLADALWYTQSLYKPAVMIDFATLTGAMRIALGNKFAGLFTNNDALADQLYKVGLETGERVWRLPLDKEYNETIDSDIADVKNLADAGAGAGSIVAAEFLQRFVNKTPWAHIDIAAVADAVSSKSRPSLKGPTAFGVRLMVQFIESQYAA